MMVRYLFFNFAGQFDLGCFSLAQEMSFCDLLPALLQGIAYHLPTVSLPAFPAFVY
jgi:hypothetical protein